MFTTSSNGYLVFLFLSPVMWYCSFPYFLLSQEIVADDELVFVSMLLLDTVQICSCQGLAVVMKWLTIIFTYLSFSFRFLSFSFGVPALRRAHVFPAISMRFLLVLEPYWIPHILVITSNHFVKTVFRCPTTVMPMARKQCKQKGGFFYVHAATKNFLKSVRKIH